jgi:hypothetical protein
MVESTLSCHRRPPPSRHRSPSPSHILRPSPARLCICICIKPVLDMEDARKRARSLAVSRKEVAHLRGSWLPRAMGIERSHLGARCHVHHGAHASSRPSTFVHRWPSSALHPRRVRTKLRDATKEEEKQGDTKEGGRAITIATEDGSHAEDGGAPNSPCSTVVARRQCCSLCR